MLTELKPVVKEKKLIGGSTLEYQRAEQLANFILGKHLISSEELYQEYTLEKGTGIYKVLARGIVEDFKIFLDEKLVMEYVYDNVYHVNKELVDLILD